jgi:hypothetical protein
LYNKETEVCDWPENVTCPTGCKTGIYPHATECNLFYQCVDGHQFEDQKCPDGLNFNSATDECDFPENVTCPEQPTTPTQEPTPTTTETPKCNKGDKKAHETECKKYYECNRKGVEELKTCGWMKIFDTQKTRCDYKYKWGVKCTL